MRKNLTCVRKNRANLVTETLLKTVPAIERLAIEQLVTEQLAVEQRVIKQLVVEPVMPEKMHLRVRGMLNLD